MLVFIGKVGGLLVGDLGYAEVVHLAGAAEVAVEVVLCLGARVDAVFFSVLCLEGVRRHRLSLALLVWDVLFDDGDLFGYCFVAVFDDEYGAVC